MQKLFSLVVFIFFLPSISFAQVKTSVDIQSIQTRTYDYNERGTFRAVLAVLQNNKFENLRSDSNAGLVTATLPSLMAGDSAEEQIGKTIVSNAIGFIVPFGNFLGPDIKTGTKERSISVTVEEISKDKTNVRILLKETESLVKTGFLGATSQELKENDMTDRPQTYQRIFSEIDKEIFIRTNR